MHIFGSSDVTIVNCTFSENFAVEGGAMHLDTGVASATLINCLFHENDAIDHGGAIDVGSASPAFFDVINCTFVANTAGDEQGGAFFVEDPEVGDGPMVFITNSILWFNTPDQIEQAGGDITIRYTNFQGFLPPPWDDGNNISSVPIFDLGFRLAEGSPGIDVGNNDDVSCDEFDLDNDGDACLPPDDEGTPDLDLINRVLDGLNNGTATVDMGSYEFINPLTCRWDLDGNGDVGVGDLLIMLATWGPCADCGNCPADFDGNCDVGVGDLLILLAMWGPCPPYSVEPPSLEEELADACLTQDDWDDFVEVMQNGNPAEKNKYLCWMIHYLDHCNKCTCTHIPLCPGPDPFG